VNATKALTVTEVRNANATKVVALVEAKREQLQKLLVGQDVERFMTVALQAVTSNPDLLDADPISILSAIREAATHGLEPVGPLGDGAIIPYRENGRAIAQFQPMYRGLMKLARRSGEVAAIDGKVVYEHDLYEREFGTNPFIRHIPTPLGQDRGKYVGVYAYARLKTGELVVVELTLADIVKIRRSSRTDKVWKAHPEPMMLKSALKRLMKLLPLEPTATSAIALDDQVEGGTPEAVRPAREVSPAKASLLGRLGVRPPETPQDVQGGDDAADDVTVVSVDPSPPSDDPEASDEMTDEELDELARDVTPEIATEDTLGLER
jgi:recombination protein RecT